MPIIINQNYRNFLDGKGIIILTVDDLEKALGNLKGEHLQQARALLILLYYSGCRPAEAVEVIGKDIQKVGSFLEVNLKGLKHGNDRKILISIGKKFVTELYTYASHLFPEMYIFSHFKTDGRQTINGKEYIRNAYKVNYHVKKAFKGVLPEDTVAYFLRHNRFSSMSEQGASPEQIRHYKGAKTLDSVVPYLHLSKEGMIKASRFIK